MLRAHEKIEKQRVLSVDLHDTVLTAAREISWSGSNECSFWDRLISSYYGKEDGSGALELRTVDSRMSSFKKWWHTVKDDGCIYEHIIWLLSGARRFTELFRLMNTPGWIMNQLKSNGRLL